MEYLLGTGRGEAVGETVLDDEIDLHVPALCDVEIAAVLRRGLLSGELETGRAGEAVADYRDLPLVRHGHLALLERALGLRANVSACDAVYVALAEGLAGELLTADDRLARAVREHTSVPLAGR